jgi:hypothetical protein
MKTYKQINFSQISEILMQAAIGVSAVCGYRCVCSDMIYSLSSLGGERHLWKSGDKRPFYIAIREQGTESGYKEDCIERCKMLGYPLVIAKIEADKACDYNMTIMFTHGWMSGDNNSMEQEFNSL